MMEIVHIVLPSHRVVTYRQWTVSRDHNQSVRKKPNDPKPVLGVVSLRSALSPLIYMDGERPRATASAAQKQSLIAPGERECASVSPTGITNKCMQTPSATSANGRAEWVHAAASTLKTGPEQKA
ncbi:hypothetical protein BaRGS_00012370 [Batillaria attramentaria]|uniref:Uncharacterized protein n=1 Tax=Batillaria attramentaria TaxID=370345 RepID=A0ABD0LAP6_9CAEN